MLSLLLLPSAATAQTFIVEQVRHDLDTLEARRLNLIEKQVGISRHDFKFVCDIDFQGVAEVVQLPSGNVIMSSRINGTRASTYFASVVTMNPQHEDSLYRADIQFEWFSERTPAENQAVQTSVTGRKGKNAYSKFDFPQKSDTDGVRVIWVYSLKNAAQNWAPAYSLRVRPLVEPSP